MMKSILNMTLFLMAFALFAACKNTKADKAETGDATEVSDATGSSYDIDVTNSIVRWEGAKPTGKHNGTINISEGTLIVSDGNLTGGSFVLDMNSIKDLDLPEDKSAMLEAHLKGTVEGKEDDFFNVNNFPTAKFEITKVSSLSGDENANSLVYGNLTLRDVTKEIGFKANVGVEDGAVKAATPNFSIDRTDWGVKYGSNKFFDNLADNFVNDEIVLSVELVTAK